MYSHCIAQAHMHVRGQCVHNLCFVDDRFIVNTNRLIVCLCFDSIRFTVYCIFLACTNLLMSLNVVSIAGCSVSVKLEHFLWILWQFFPSCPSRAARIYLKNRNISTLSDVGFRSSFSSLWGKNQQKNVFYHQKRDKSSRNNVLKLIRKWKKDLEFFFRFSFKNKHK